MKLKKSERSVLRLLEQDGRMSFSLIGKKTRMSQQRVSYTVSSLIKREVIHNFFPLIDYSKFGLIGFRVYFRINYINENKFNELIDFFVNNEHTYWVKRCSGRYDLIVTFLASNVSQFNKILRSSMEKFPQQLQSHNVLTNIVIRFFGRKYLIGRSGKITQKIIGGDREVEKVDEIDIKLLSGLANNARMSSVKLAEITGVTPKTVINRIENLKRRKILKGFGILVDPKDIGGVSHILLIKYHNISLKLENDLINFLRYHPNVTSLVKTLGEWDVEITLENKNLVEFRKVEMEIRQKFGLLIQNVESALLERTYKMSYFPKFLLE